MKYIHRDKEKDLLRYLDDPEEHKRVLIVGGARQVGKSRMVEEVLKNRDEPVYKLNLETSPLDLKKIDSCNDFAEFSDFLEDRFNFNASSRFILYIDEAQESRKIGGFVRSMKEEWKKASVILTGSSMSRLFRDDVRYPVGRVSRVIIRPFSFREFLRGAGRTALSELLAKPDEISAVRHNNLLNLCDQYMTTGGLPAALSAFFEGKGDLREEILADIEADFFRLFEEDLIDMVSRCLRAVANLAGSAFKNTAITGSQLSNTQNDKINSILKRFEDWNIVLKSEQHGPAPERSYHPKRYFFDIGLLKILRESAVPDLRVLTTIDAGSRTALGGVIENFTAAELSAMDYKYSGWKKSSTGTEVDFVIKSEGRAFPVECKAAVKITSRNLAGIKNYFEMNDTDTGFIVSAARFEIFPVGDGKKIYNIPLYSLNSIPGFLK